MTAPVVPLKLDLGSGGPGWSGMAPDPTTPEDRKVLKVTDRAKYKIELFFSRKRTARGLTAVALTIWESGLRFHGGGDDKMYWCGYPDCKKPIASRNFGYAHVVCPTCKREQFLDPPTKKDHIAALIKGNQPVNDLDKLPIISGEKYCKLYPEGIADLLVTTFNDLNRDADFYFKYQPVDMRYDPVHETVADMNRLDKARLKREPVIYPLSRLLVDLSNGSDLKKRLLTFITA
jgi:hypothetical protein